MSPTQKIPLAKGDFVVAGVILLLTLFLFLYFVISPRATNPKAYVYVQGRLHQVIDLSALTTTVQYEIHSNGYHLLIEALPGKIRMLSADCPDQICVRTGLISSSSFVIACVPAQVFIKIQMEDTDIDVVLS